MTENVVKIQKWWRYFTSTKTLSVIYNYLLTNLTKQHLQELSNMCDALLRICQGKDGSGLSSGLLIDILINNYFEKNLSACQNFYKNECDLKICDISISLKKITGKSQLALDWSKNEITKKKKYFTCHILIINLKSEKWWKKSPVNKINNNLIFTDILPMGIYIIDKKFCKYHIELSSNNKTNSLIKEQYLYLILKRCIFQKLFIEIPVPNKVFKFNILNAFLE
jgi:hypothetical protein